MNLLSNKPVRLIVLWLIILNLTFFCFTIFYHGTAIYTVRIFVIIQFLITFFYFIAYLIKNVPIKNDAEKLLQQINKSIFYKSYKGYFFNNL
jgi:hypothetical protein